MYQRNTIQRRAILETVKKLQNHPSADEVYVEIVKDHPSISRATVYRGLHELSEAGELKRVECLGGADHYDHCLIEHYHVRCTSCDRVFDVDMPFQGELSRFVKDSHGFVFTGYDIVFKGICSNCQKNLSEDKIV